VIQPAGAPNPELPWGLKLEPGSVAFAAIWTTGPDPAADRALRLVASRSGPLGTDAFDRMLRAAGTGGGSGGDEAASQRTQRELGLTAAELAGGVEPREAAAELGAFLEGATVVVPERAPFEAWLARLSGTGEVPVRVVGLTDAAALLLPGRLASEGERLAATLVGRAELVRRPRAVMPADLRDALVEIVARLDGFAARGASGAANAANAANANRSEKADIDVASETAEGGVLGLIAHAQLEAWEALRDEDPRAASDQAFLLSLAEHPTAWIGGGALFAAGIPLADGRLSAAFRAFESIHHAADELRPAWGRAAKAELRREPFPNVIEGPQTLAADDRRLVDEILQEHLPRAFAPRPGDASSAPSYRAGQHAVAAEIAAGFGLRALQLLHAPTGTGKTLAYLVPTALWAFRNGVRVGIATFTRALQEQALDREVPLLRALLRKAGVSGELHIALLKGRENYLCWRALRLQTPERRDSAHARLAWAVLAGFALTDPDGDLDRLPRRAPLGLEDPDGYRRALERLIAESRSRSGCCLHRADREDCGGHASRRRAERAHVVVTNHAFALARREFFRHLVFDECEHLHAQAHRAFSHIIALRALRELLTLLYKPGGASRAPLNRVAAVCMPETEAAECLARCIDAQEEALTGLDELQRAVYRFKLWREDVGGQRDERDNHSLFREYAEGEDAGDLLAAHAGLYGGLVDLGVALSELAENLDTLPTRGVQRIRRTLDILRADLDEVTAGVEAWIPRGEHGEPLFRGETFHDLETTPRGFDVMVARVLLPHEHLGRHYYPELAGAVLISATTWLKGGFDAQSRYLGCWRAANPAEDEERAPTPLSTFRAPDAFDYSRVLVCAPRDAPAPNAGKRAALEYVARFACYLGERTRGRMLVLFTNADDCAKAAHLAQPFFDARRIPFWHQRMEGAVKEELSERFRATVDSVMFGLDTFWYGADFPGETLEHLVIARLPYGVPDRYHHAQSAVLGAPEQRRAIYMPRALAKFRQGFGRLMRKESDRGCVYLLDPRVLDPRHRGFLRELPLSMPELGDANPHPDGVGGAGARLVRGDAERCFREAFAHMGLLADLKRRKLDSSFAGWRADRSDAVLERPPIDESELPF
jgi:ATP-dependent DNA helicase DinG